MRSFSIYALMLFLAVMRAVGQPSRPVRDKAWNLLSLSIDSKGPGAEDALRLLGSLDDDRALKLLNTIFKEQNQPALSIAAQGLSPMLSNSYLPELKQAAFRSRAQWHPGVLEAVARAMTPEAAEVLRGIADAGEEPAAGIALGLLEKMGAIAEPVLEKEVIDGRSAKSRETAVYVLCRVRDPKSIGAFKKALGDPDPKVRLGAAYGLALFGIRTGRAELEIAAKGVDLDRKIDALTGLAMLGIQEGLDGLTQFLQSADPAIRAKTVWAMARSGNSDVKALCYHLGLEAKPEFRAMLEDKLFDPNDPQDLAILNEDLTGSDPNASVIAAEKLMNSSSHEKARAKIIQAFHGSNLQARDLALSIMSGKPEFWAQLAGGLNSSDTALQVAALTAIAHLHQQARFGEVERLYLSIPPREVSLAAAQTLFALDERAAQVVFEKQMDSATDYTRIYSAAMLLRSKHQ